MSIASIFKNVKNMDRVYVSNPTLSRRRVSCYISSQIRTVLVPKRAAPLCSLETYLAHFSSVSVSSSCFPFPLSRLLSLCSNFAVSVFSPSFSPSPSPPRVAPSHDVRVCVLQSVERSALCIVDGHKREAHIYLSHSAHDIVPCCVEVLVESTCRLFSGSLSSRQGKARPP